MWKKVLCFIFLLVPPGPPTGLNSGSGGVWAQANASTQNEDATKTLSLLGDGGFEETILISATDVLSASSCPAAKPVGWEEISLADEGPCDSTSSRSSLWRVDFEEKLSGNASLHVIHEGAPVVIASDAVEISAQLSSVTATVFVKGGGEVSACLLWMVDHCLLKKDWLAQKGSHWRDGGRSRWIELASTNVVPPSGAEKVRMVLISRASRNNIVIHRLKNAGAKNVAHILNEVFSTVSNPRRRPVIVADERLNAIIVYSPYGSETRRALELTSKLDAVDPWRFDSCPAQKEDKEVITELRGSRPEVWWDDAEMVGVYAR